MIDCITLWPLVEKNKVNYNVSHLIVIYFLVISISVSDFDLYVNNINITCFFLIPFSY